MTSLAPGSDFDPLQYEERCRFQFCGVQPPLPESCLFSSPSLQPVFVSPSVLYLRPLSPDPLSPEIDVQSDSSSSPIVVDDTPLPQAEDVPSADDAPLESPLGKRAHAEESDVDDTDDEYVPVQHEAKRQRREASRVRPPSSRGSTSSRSTVSAVSRVKSIAATLRGPPSRPLAETFAILFSVTARKTLKVAVNSFTHCPICGRHDSNLKRHVRSEHGRSWASEWISGTLSGADLVLALILMIAETSDKGPFPEEEDARNTIIADFGTLDPLSYSASKEVEEYKCPAVLRAPFAAYLDSLDCVCSRCGQDFSRRDALVRHQNRGQCTRR